jgi:hypothetical protein
MQPKDSRIGIRLILILHLLFFIFFALVAHRLGVVVDVIAPIADPIVADPSALCVIAALSACFVGVVWAVVVC